MNFIISKIITRISQQSIVKYNWCVNKIRESDMDRKFKCRFFGYVELGMSLSDITDDYRQQILKLAISKLCKRNTMNDDEIEIAEEKMKLANVSTKEKRLFKAWKKLNLKIELNAWNISILNEKERL